MKHFPASRAPAHLTGLSDNLTQSTTTTLRRSTALLFAAVIFAAGFFSGAIVFGLALVRQHDGAPASSLNLNFSASTCGNARQ